MGLKKTDSISPKTQHFVYTNFSSIEDHNQTKQPFQKIILHKKRYSKPPYKILTSSIHKFIPKFLTYPYLDFFFFSSLLLLFFYSSLLFFSSSILLFSSSLFFSSLFPQLICPNKRKKNEFLLNPCLALSNFA